MAVVTETPLTVLCPHCHRNVEVTNEQIAAPISCPECERSFEVQPPTAVPVEPVVEEVKQEQIREAFSAPQPDEAIYTVRPNIIRRYPGRVLLYLTIMIFGMLLVISSLMSAEYSLLKLLGGVGLTIWGTVRMGAWYLRMTSTTVSLTPRVLVIRQGAFSTETTEVPLTSIQKVQASQDFLGRILNVGDIGIATTGRQGNFLIRGVRNPEDFVRAWQSVRDEATRPPEGASA